MKNFLNKKYTLVVLALAALVTTGYYFASTHFSFVESAKAGDCKNSSGDLYGYIDTENVGPVYLSRKSFEDATGETMDDNFYADFDRQTFEWSGKGWNKQVGWVDFSYNKKDHIVRFVAPGEEYDTGCNDNGTCDEWGGWNGEADLSDVVYSAQNGSFQGTGIDKHDNTGNSGDDEEEDTVGSGTWTFEHVEFIEPECPETINLYIGCNNYWYDKNCPAELKDVPLQWTSENVADCESVEGAGFWDLTARDPQNTGTDVTANGTLDKCELIRFTIKCKGIHSQMDIIDTVTASCGETQPDPDTKIISPILIEA